MSEQSLSAYDDVVGAALEKPANPGVARKNPAKPGGRRGFSAGSFAVGIIAGFVVGVVTGPIVLILLLQSTASF